MFKLNYLVDENALLLNIYSSGISIVFFESANRIYDKIVDSKFETMSDKLVTPARELLNLYWQKQIYDNCNDYVNNIVTFRMNRIKYVGLLLFSPSPLRNDIFTVLVAPIYDHNVMVTEFVPTNRFVSLNDNTYYKNLSLMEKCNMCELLFSKTTSQLARNMLKLNNK